MMRSIWLIAKSVLIEAVRRKEIYVIILLSSALIVAAGGMRLFGFVGMAKFFREVCLQVMNLATALTVIILASRQLPREFENRTIYPLLAKPVSRLAFLAGKYLGVMLAGLFCYFIFILLFIGGMFLIEAPLLWPLFLQAVYLQMLALGMVGALAFLLSLLFNIDASITVTSLIFFLAGTVSTAIDYAFEYIRDTLTVGGIQIGKHLMLAINYVIPNLSLFDLSAKVVHSTDMFVKDGQVQYRLQWEPVEGWVLGALTIYALGFMIVYLALSHFLFSRRAL